MLLVDVAHERGRRRQDLVDEDEDGLLGREADALADDVDELADGEVGGNQVLLLVDGRDVRLLDLLADDLMARQLDVFLGVEAARLRSTRVTPHRPQHEQENSPECGQSTSGGCARPRPCASRRGARP